MEHCINNQIREKRVNLVTDKGIMLENITIEEAIHIAGEKGLDVVQVSPAGNGKNSICKVMDYGKLKYKKEKNHHKNKPHKDTTKEIKFNYNISDHDLDVKNNKVRELLESEYRVRYVLELKGRFKLMKEEARKKMMNSLMEFDGIATISDVAETNDSIFTTLSPCKVKTK